MILLNKPYRKDDFVEAAGTSGTVQEVSIFNTVLRTPDNIKVIVPNAQVTNDEIKNYSANDTRRVDLVVGIGYEDHIGRAKETLLNILSTHNLVLGEPAPTVEVLELGDSSVNLAVRCWAGTSNYWSVRCDVLEQIKTSFDEVGINLPYPQREITIRGQNGKSGQ